MALSCRKKVVSVELPLKSGLRSPLSATDLNTRGKTLHIILVKGHFFSDDSALTNKPDAKTQLLLISFKIWAFKS